MVLVVPGRRLTLAFVPVCALCACAACGCGGGGADRRPTVVATTTQAADLVRNLAGDRMRVVGLLAPNSDPHEYEVRPRDVKALARASVIVRSGGEVDGWLDGAIDSAGSGAPVLDLLGRVGAEGDDPHWWQDPRRALVAVEAIRQALTRADPAGAVGYRRRAAAYSRRLRALDGGVAACLARIPPAQRQLVTTHDALGYYARRYGLRVIGTVIPSLSTQAQASAGDLARLIATVRREHVRAIFAESAVNPGVERAIARETGARVGRALWADTLGPPGSGAETYVASIRANTEAIAEGLSGGGTRCTLPR